MEIKDLFLDQPLDGLTGARPWRLNLCASNASRDSFFVAVYDKVLVFPSLGYYPCSFDVEPIAELGLHAPQDLRTSINAIRTGYLGSEEVLVTVDDGGIVVLYSLKDLKKPPVQFDNQVSTWGIALHSASKRLAVSSNAHDITIYTIVNDDFKAPTVTHLRGHTHNIPSINFSHTGRFLVSASIDGSCRLWDIESEELMACNAFAQTKWNWTACFIQNSDIQLSAEPFVQSSAVESSGRQNPDLLTNWNYQRIENLLRDVRDSTAEDDTGLDLSDSNSASEERSVQDEENFIVVVESDSFFTASEEGRGGDWTSSAVTTPSDGVSSEDNSGHSSLSDERERFVSVTEHPLAIEEEEAKESLMKEELILRTTADDIYLMKVSLSKLVYVASLKEMLVGWEERYAYRGMNRLSMVEWIPELSLGVVASQMGKVGLVLIQRHEDDDYSMKIQDWLPKTQSFQPILGLFITKQISQEDPALNVITLNLVTYDGMLSSYYLGLAEPSSLSDISFL